jgi:hypothetical protein
VRQQSKAFRVVYEAFSDRIDRDGRALCFSAKLKGAGFFAASPAIPSTLFYIHNDVIEREIVMPRFRIVEKLAPVLGAKLSQARAGETLELRREDIDG